jgi:uncharacterized protein (DUF1501 family)
MDIWNSGSLSQEYWSTGWIGRYLDAQCAGCEKPAQALEIDDTLSLALKGTQYKGLAVQDPKRLYGTSNERYFRELLQQHQPGHGHHDEQPVDYLYKTMAETLSTADYIFSQSRLHPTRSDYPKTEMGNAFKTIASLIFSDINTKVYYLSLGSFDTHVNQQAQQQKLFTQMNGAIEVFVKDLKAAGRYDDVLLMTFSEFGRRVAQNASGGTDHGMANNMFLLSGGLKQQGLLNALPDLTKLQDGDIQYQVDFKSVYATLLRNWLGADDVKILGREYERLQFV